MKHIVNFILTNSSHLFQNRRRQNTEQGTTYISVIFVILLIVSGMRPVNVLLYSRLRIHGKANIPQRQYNSIVAKCKDWAQHTWLSISILAIILHFCVRTLYIISSTKILRSRNGREPSDHNWKSWKLLWRTYRNHQNSMQIEKGTYKTLMRVSAPISEGIPPHMKQSCTLLHH